jgi:hypothetical protein
MDSVIEELPRALLGHLNGTELAELIRLLELARKPAQARLEPAS